MSTRTFILLRTLLAAAALTGCGAADDLACASFMGAHAFRYMGPVIGDGEFVLARADDGLTARITLRDDMGSGATIEIEGPGECTGSGLRVRFGPGDHAEAAYRVIGGSFVVTRDPLAFDWFFGAWSASVVLKHSGATDTLRGFIRERDPGEAP